MAWDAMVALGAYHGINPGMGWLFAVALGMQQGSARGVWRALPPIALGHAMAVGLVLLVAGLAGLIVPLETMRVIVAGMLMTFGLYRLWSHRHPRYAGMQVTFGTLTVWSFLMASAHGAGFMVLPFVMRMLTGGPTRDRGIGPDKINLPEFEAASIREVPGTCPATPAAPAR